MADRDGPSFDRWSEVGDLLAVNGGWNMHRCGGVKCATVLAVACPRSPREGPARGATRPPRGWRRPARRRDLAGFVVLRNFFGGQYAAMLVPNAAAVKLHAIRYYDCVIFNSRL